MPEAIREEETLKNNGTKVTEIFKEPSHQPDFGAFISYWEYRLASDT